jgi:uncharacterized membrane protein YjgN (DUF898 family)
MTTPHPGDAGLPNLPVPTAQMPVPLTPPATTTAIPATVPADHRRTDVPAFYFDGGAASYVGTGILAFLITVVTFGIALPFAIVLRLRWRANHTYIEGRRLMFTGTGIGLFGNWIKWWFLSIITLGIYLFWVVPRLTKWQVEHQAFAPTSR